MLTSFQDAGPVVVLWYAHSESMRARTTAVRLARAAARVFGGHVVIVDGPVQGQRLFDRPGVLPRLSLLLSHAALSPQDFNLPAGRGAWLMDGQVTRENRPNAVRIVAELTRCFSLVIACVPYCDGDLPAPLADRYVGIAGDEPTPGTDLLAAVAAKAALPVERVHMVSTCIPDRATGGQRDAWRNQHRGFGVIALSGRPDDFSEPLPHSGIAMYARILARRRVGLALGSGGPRGFAHIGVLEALRHLQVPIDCLVGSSAGAGIGGVWSLGFDPDKIFLRYAKTSRYAFWPVLGSPSLLSGTLLHRHLRQTAEGRGFEDMQVPFGAVAVDMFSGEQVTLTSGSFPRAVLASTAIPGLYPPVRIDGRWLVDGGLLAPVPVEACRRMGADVVMGVDLGTRSCSAPAPRRTPGIVTTVRCALELMHWRLHHETGRRADVRIFAADANLDAAGPGTNANGGYGARVRSRGWRATFEAWPEMTAAMPWLAESSSVPICLG